MHFSVFLIVFYSLLRRFCQIINYLISDIYNILLWLHAVACSDCRFEPQHYLVWPSLIKELELIELRRNNENAEKRLKRMDEESACRRVASFG